MKRINTDRKAQIKSITNITPPLPAFICGLLFLLLAACGEQSPAVVAIDPSPVAGGATAVSATNPASTTPNPTATERPPATASSTPVATATATPTITPSVTPTATPDLYGPLTIDALAARSYGGGLLQIERTLEENDKFARYLISYPSDGLTIYGFMNVPNEGHKFPVAIILHGYINPTVYDTIAYTKRYADALAEAGYFVIHPNFRNYPPSDSGPDPYRIGFAIDTLNLIAIIREQSQDITGTLRRADADDINLMGHSMGGGVALRVITVNPAPYLRTAVLYGSMSGDETLNYEQIMEWSGGRNGSFELAAPAGMMQAIAPIYHLERLQAAVSIHHSDADAVVPFAWSEDLCGRLQALQHPVECFTYAGQPHTFRGYGDALFMERMIAFFDRY